MSSTPERRIAHVAVVVPARDEEALIGAALDSIDRSRHLLDGVTTSCVVVLDDCTDSTSTLLAVRRPAAAVAAPVVVSIGRRCVGAARAAGFEAALLGSGCRPGEVWLASTDADTIVPSDWLTSQLRLAETGVDAVAGIVELGGDTTDVLTRGFRTRYAVGADGTHRHVHGANLAMRGDAYLAAGGWSWLPTGEDHDLWNRLREVARCVSSTSITVRTNARLVGRAPAGFARDLRAIASTETVA